MRRTVAESQNSSPSTMFVMLLLETSAKGAFGFVVDKDILELVCYGFDDTQMKELLRLSLEKAFLFKINIALNTTCAPKCKVRFSSFYILIFYLCHRSLGCPKYILGLTASRFGFDVFT